MPILSVSKRLQNVLVSFLIDRESVIVTVSIAGLRMKNDHRVSPCDNDKEVNSLQSSDSDQTRQ